mmetsp:Transcript_26684/g.30813  ORF Transcript_26684/g.30813 Transcript_26684/m.30813 type:complete len:98 (-) Transcript_26684:74-367(-)
MHPLASCCLYYCSGMMVIGLFFFAVLFIMIETDSNKLAPTKDGTKADLVKTVAIAAGINVVCLFFCVITIIIMRRRGDNNPLINDKPVFDAYIEDDN